MWYLRTCAAVTGASVELHLALCPGNYGGNSWYADCLMKTDGYEFVLTGGWRNRRRNRCRACSRSGIARFAASGWQNTTCAVVRRCMIAKSSSTARIRPRIQSKPCSKTVRLLLPGREPKHRVRLVLRADWSGPILNLPQTQSLPRSSPPCSSAHRC